MLCSHIVPYVSPIQKSKKNKSHYLFISLSVSFVWETERVRLDPMNRLSKKTWHDTKRRLTRKSFPQMCYNASWEKRFLPSSSSSPFKWAVYSRISRALIYLNRISQASSVIVYRGHLLWPNLRCHFHDYYAEYTCVVCTCVAVQYTIVVYAT